MSISTLPPQTLLSWPTALNLSDTMGTTDTAPRSWIQVARVGAFQSKRYGKFSITRDDLAQMLHNFRHVTPKAPTELPIDFDHLSMDPQRPGDGAAAGWMKKLELRDGGDTLWAEVEWTDDGADRIRKKEYRFVSPSFVKNHTYKDGSQIGTTLLAAAITNHPFLEAMTALTLATPAIQAMNLSAPLRDLVAVEDGVISLSKVGQHVSIAQADDLTPEERAMTFVIAEVRGEGDDALAFLKALDGRPFGWHRAARLAAARTAPDQTTKDIAMSNTTMSAAQTLMTRAQQLVAEGRLDLSTAVKQAAAEDAAAATDYLAQMGSAARHSEPTVTPTAITLHRAPDEGFVELVGRVQRERRIDLRDAIRAVSLAYPALADDYSARG